MSGRTGAVLSAPRDSDMDTISRRQLPSLAEIRWLQLVLAVYESDVFFQILINPSSNAN